MKRNLVIIMSLIVCFVVSACTNLTNTELQQNNFFISLFTVVIIYILLFVAYLYNFNKANDRHKVDKIFLFLTLIMTILTYIYFLIKFKIESNTNYLAGPYIIFILIVLLNNMIINSNDSKKVMIPVIVKLIVLIILQVLLVLITDYLNNWFNMSNKIASVACSTSLIGIAIYTSYILIKQSRCFNDIWWNATLKTYILIYYLFIMLLYLIDDSDNVIGSIIVLLSIVMALFQNIDSIVDYLTLKIKNNS